MSARSAPISAHGRYRRYRAGWLHPDYRPKDVIKSDREWVSSLQVEELIEQFPDVEEAAVIGISDEKWGERPFAVVVKDSDHAGASGSRSASGSVK